MEKINSGDPILVCMTRNDIFPWQKSPSFEAIFHHAPAGAGDTFVIEINGKMLLLNGNSTDFIGIVQLPKEEDSLVKLH